MVKLRFALAIAAACALAGCTSTPPTSTDASLADMLLNGSNAGLAFYPVDVGQLLPAVEVPRADQTTVPEGCNEYLLVGSDNVAAVGSNSDSTVIVQLYSGDRMYQLTSTRVETCPEIEIFRSDIFYARTNTSALLDAHLPDEYGLFGFNAVTVHNEVFGGGFAKPTTSMQLIGLVEDTTVVVEVLGHDGAPDLGVAVDAFEAQAAQIVGTR